MKSPVSKAVWFATLVLLFTACKSQQISESGTSPDKYDDLVDEETVVEDYYGDEPMRYDNISYRETIQTVQLYREGWELTPPIIGLNEGDQLHLNFDDLSGDYTDYEVTFFHCNADWTPSELAYSEFVEGLPTDFVTEYKYSRNTYQKYIHYAYVFPNQNIRFTKSGNYLVMVYTNSDQEDPILTRRFMVVDRRVEVAGNIQRSNTVSERNSRQEVDFTIRYADYQLTNPYSDLKIVIMQNFRWDNAIFGLEPVFAKDGELVYDHDEINVFDGGNEWRPLDMKDLNYRSVNVEVNQNDEGRNHIYVRKDKRRSAQAYLSQPDINGQRIIRIDERNPDSEVDADYAWVHFALPQDYRIPGGNLYVFGELSNWKFSKETKMVYNENDREYKGTVYLKQGYYNYQYVFVPDGQVNGDVGVIEGSHSQTENDYTILVYHRSLGDEYDRLVSVETFKFP